MSVARRLHAIGAEDVDVFRRILCATDFSDAAEGAWDVARELAGVHRAELELIHVFVKLPLYSVAEMPGPGVAQIWEEQRAWVQKTLDERAMATRSSGLLVRTHLKTGTPASAIVETAVETDADLIVIGTHGRTGLDRLLIGSVAERVVRLAPCPVLTVKPRIAPQAQRAAA
jgi:nucleotide-binding universal stress UspA family protein